MDDFSAFARLLDTLRPWLGHLVIVGGWAHRLHRFHEQAHPPVYLPVTTRDADVAFSTSAPLKGNIAKALRNANFREDYFGEDTPPVTQYRLGADEQGFYVEFLTPLRGDGLKRDGRSDVTVTKAGVVAQKLRHLELLLVAPWAVQLSSEVGVPVARRLTVRVPNPVTFIAQKILVQKHRQPEKKAQDALYIHDTLDLFSGNLGGLRVLWRDEIRRTIPPKTANDVERLTHELFGAVNDVLRNAARIPQDRALSVERIQEASDYGLQQVFGAG